MQVCSLSLEDLLDEEMETHYGILASRIPWTEKTGGLQSTGSQQVRQDWSDLVAAGPPKMFTYISSHGQNIW